MSVNRRKTIYIYKDFQKSFVFGFCLATFGAMVTTSIILLMLFNWTSKNEIGHSLYLLIGINSLVLVVVLLLTAIVALLASHKIAGPLFRVENALAAIGRGDLTERVKLREDDQLKQLAGQINQMTESLKARVEGLEVELQNLRQAADGGDLTAVKGLVSSVSKSLDEKFILR